MNFAVTPCAKDSLEDDVGSGVDALADIIICREGEDPGAAAGPHRPAVQRVHWLAQAHDGHVDISHGQDFNGLPVLLLRGEEGEAETSGQIYNQMEKAGKQNPVPRKHTMFWFIQYWP